MSSTRRNSNRGSCAKAKKAQLNSCVRTGERGYFSPNEIVKLSGVNRAIMCVFVRDGVNAIADLETPPIHPKTSDKNDLCDEDAETLSMLGKYGNAGKMLAMRNGDDFLLYNLDGVGRQTFGFRTPRKKNMMDKTAQILSTPPRSTDKRLSLLTNSGSMTPTARRAVMNATIVKSREETPRRKLVHQFANSTAGPGSAETPIKKMRLRVGENEAPTPQAVRTRVSRTLAKIKEVEEEEGETTDEDSDEELELKSAEEGVVDSPSFRPRRSCSSARQKFSIKEDTDMYFEAHGTNKVATSDNTIDRSKLRRGLSPEEMQEILNREKIQYAVEIKKLQKVYTSHFNKWLLWLREDFNLICYGLGSKKSLLAHFQMYVSEREAKSHFVVVNGFFPSLTVKHVLNAITKELLMEQETYSVLSDHCEAITKSLRQLGDQTVYLIVNNLDGIALRSDKAQEVLCQLAVDVNIKLVASVDHINAPLLWDSEKTNKFNFIWFDATSFLPYAEETLNEHSLMGRHGAGGRSGLALNSLARVFESLTPNAKGIYLAIVEYQLNAVKHLKENLEEGQDDGGKVLSYQGISFKTLYQRCRKAFLVNSDLTLRAQLTEFRDHKLIKERKGADDGIDYLVIPLNNSTLGEFLEQQEVTANQ